MQVDRDFECHALRRGETRAGRWLLRGLKGEHNTVESLGLEGERLGERAEESEFPSARAHEPGSAKQERACRLDIEDGEGHTGGAVLYQPGERHGAFGRSPLLLRAPREQRRLLVGVLDEV